MSKEQRYEFVLPTNPPKDPKQLEVYDFVKTMRARIVMSDPIYIGVLARDGEVAADRLVSQVRVAFTIPQVLNMVPKIKGVDWFGGRADQQRRNVLNWLKNASWLEYVIPYEEGHK